VVLFLVEFPAGSDTALAASILHDGKYSAKLRL